MEGTAKRLHAMHLRTSSHDLQPQLRQSRSYLIRATSAECLGLPADIETLGSSIQVMANDTSSDHFFELIVHNRLAIPLAAVWEFHLLGQSAGMRRDESARWIRTSGSLCSWHIASVVPRGMQRLELCSGTSGRLLLQLARLEKSSRGWSGRLVVVGLRSRWSIEYRFDV